MGCFKIHENNFFVVRNLSDYTKNSNDSHDSKKLIFENFQESDCNILIFKRKSFDKNNRSKNRAKHYDSSTGRFLSEDPIRFSSGDENLFRYTKNSPVLATDPYGNVSLGEVIIGTCIAGYLFYKVGEKLYSSLDNAQKAGVAQINSEKPNSCINEVSSVKTFDQAQKAKECNPKERIYDIDTGFEGNEKQYQSRESK